MAELLSELKNGVASFSMIGTVKISPDTFKGVQQPKEGSFWVSVRTSLPIAIEQGVMLFPDINDGYKTTHPVIIKYDKGEKIEIPFKERGNKDFCEKVPTYEFYKTNIEKDEDGKPIMKEFLHGIDFEKYLKDNLKDGTNVRIMGSVEYGYDKDRTKVYRNYRIKSVFLNEGYTKNGEFIEPVANSGTFTQTYLVDAASLDDRWEKDLEGKGKTAINLYVPSYMGRAWNGSTYADLEKKMVAMPQQVFVTADPSDAESLTRAKKLVERLFKIGKRKVREITLTVKINEGSETVVGDVEVDGDLKELLDAGLISMDEIKKQVTVRGNRVSELLFVKPQVKMEEGKAVINMDDEKYSIEALAFPGFKDKDKEEVSKDVEKVEVESVPTDDPTAPISDDLYESIFG